MTGNEKQVFKDYSKQGKDRKWRERKLKNIELAGRLEKLGYRSFEKGLSMCRGFEIYRTTGRYKETLSILFL